MGVQPDFRELLASLNVHAAEFVVVGAYALAFHGVVRNTGDLDIYVRPDADNARRIMAALEDFGFGSVGLSEEDFIHAGRVVQLGYPPIRIDLITSLSGVTWEQVWAEREPGRYGDVAVDFIGRGQFIANKRASGRLKDLADIEALGEK